MAITLNGTTGIASVDASVSAPSVRGTDGNTGISYGADSIKFSTGGVERLAISNSGVSGVGKILQVAQTMKTDGWSTSIATGAEAEITGLALSFTPTLATSKVLLTVHVSAVANSSKWLMFNLKRDSTAIAIGDQHGSNRRRSTTGMFHNMGDTGMGGYDWSVLDTPSTTSAIDYQVVVANASGSTGTYYCNQSNSGDYAYRGSFVSTITAMEVAA